jgi:hypothetical protein
MVEGRGMTDAGALLLLLLLLLLELFKGLRRLPAAGLGGAEE